jgi:YVTN family beta-propeller protein
VAISPNGKKAYVANLFDDTVSVITVATGEVAADPITVGGEPGSVAFSPNGEKAYVANSNADTVSVITTR